MRDQTTEVRHIVVVIVIWLTGECQDLIQTLNPTQMKSSIQNQAFLNQALSVETFKLVTVTYSFQMQSE